MRSGRFGVSSVVSLPKIGQQFVVDDLHELLAGPDARQHLRAERLLLHLVAKLLRDLVIHVGGQQRQAHLAHGVGDVAFRSACRTRASS